MSHFSNSIFAYIGITRTDEYSKSFQIGKNSTLINNDLHNSVIFLEIIQDTIRKVYFPQCGYKGSASSGRTKNKKNSCETGTVASSFRMVPEYSFEKDSAKHKKCASMEALRCDRVNTRLTSLEAFFSQQL
jgi:hypothetical protein